MDQEQLPSSVICITETLYFNSFDWRRENLFVTEESTTVNQLDAAARTNGKEN